MLCCSGVDFALGCLYWMCRANPLRPLKPFLWYSHVTTGQNRFLSESRGDALARGTAVTLDFSVYFPVTKPGPSMVHVVLINRHSPHEPGADWVRFRSGWYKRQSRPFSRQRLQVTGDRAPYWPLIRRACAILVRNMLNITSQLYLYP
jgi:hypothetical protein